jgi:hypothetical protein
MTIEKKDYTNLGRATFCSVAFMFLSIATNSVLNFQSEAMSNEGFESLGFYNLAMLYGSLGVGCLVSTSVMNKLGTQYSMALGSLCNFVWIICSIFPALKAQYPNNNSIFVSNGFIYFISILSSVICGLGDSVQWVA